MRSIVKRGSMALEYSTGTHPWILLARLRSRNSQGTLEYCICTSATIVVKSVYHMTVVLVVALLAESVLEDMPMLCARQVLCSVIRSIYYCSSIFPTF